MARLVGGAVLLVVGALGRSFVTQSNGTAPAGPDSLQNAQPPQQPSNAPLSNYDGGWPMMPATVRVAAILAKVKKHCQFICWRQDACC